MGNGRRRDAGDRLAIDEARGGAQRPRRCRGLLDAARILRVGDDADRLVEVRQLGTGAVEREADRLLQRGGVERRIRRIEDPAASIGVARRVADVATAFDGNPDGDVSMMK